LIDDAPSLEQEAFQLPTVHAEAPLSDADRREFSPLYQLVGSGARQPEKLRRLRNPQPFFISWSVHCLPHLYFQVYQRYDMSLGVGASTLKLHFQRLQAFDLEGEQ
jgi:hypothetical protein